MKVDDVRRAKVQAGGGTAIEPVLEDIGQRKPTFAIIFTDGWLGEKWKTQAKKLRVPIIWVIVNNKGFTTPHGKVIHYKTGA